MTTFIVIFTFALRYLRFREAGDGDDGNEDCSAEEPGRPLHRQEELRGSSFKEYCFFCAMSKKVVLQDQEELRGCSFKRILFFLCDVQESCAAGSRGAQRL